MNERLPNAEKRGFASAKQNMRDSDSNKFDWLEKENDDGPNAKIFCPRKLGVAPIRVARSTCKCSRCRGESNQQSISHVAVPLFYSERVSPKGPRTESLSDGRRGVSLKKSQDTVHGEELRIHPNDQGLGLELARPIGSYFCQRHFLHHHSTKRSPKYVHTCISNVGFSSQHSPSPLPPDIDSVPPLLRF